MNLPTTFEMLSGTAKYRQIAKNITVCSVNQGLINIMKIKINKSLDEMDLTQKKRAEFRMAIFKSVDDFFKKNNK